MASIRRLNVQGQARLDAPHIRLLESALAGDFDALAGQMFVGKQPHILTGFEVSNPSTAVGRAATELTLLVASSTLLHYGATASGTVHVVPADRSPEVLNASNSRLEGSFVAASTNYVGIDLRRAADSTTADDVAFLAAGSDPPTEFTRRVPLGQVTDYVIVVSTVDFGATPTVCPVATVAVDASGLVSSITDARRRLWRLATGGSSPDRQHAYPWPAARLESASNAFRGGDKAVETLKDWVDAVMTRVWEVSGGGERWFSAMTPQNVKLIRTGALFTNGEYFEWDGTHLHWKGLKFIFPNSTGWYNDVANQTSDSSGLTNLADGECIYVDLDFSANRTGGTALVAVKAASALLGSPTVPGSRYVLAWRTGTAVFSRDQPWATGTHFSPATTTSLGAVKLSKTPTDAMAPIVLTDTERDAASGVAGLTAGRVVLGSGLQRTVAAGADILTVGGGAQDEAVAITGDSSTGNAAAVYTNDAVDPATGVNGDSFAVRSASTKRFLVTATGDGWLQRWLSHAGNVTTEETITSGGTANSFSAVTLVGSGSANMVPTGKAGGLGYDYRVKITTGGDSTAARFTFSRDGGKNYSAAQASPYTDATTGVTITLSGAGFILNDVYLFKPRFNVTRASRDADGLVREVVDHNGLPAHRLGEFREDWVDDNWAAATTVAAPSKWTTTLAGAATFSTNHADSTFVASYFSHNSGAGAMANTEEVSNHTNKKFLYVANHLVAVFQWEALVSSGVAGQNKLVQVGLRTAGINTADGIYFSKSSGGQWVAACTTGGATTSTNTGVTNPGEVTLGNFRIEIWGSTKGGGSRKALFFIDEAVVAEIATNVPQGPLLFAIITRALADNATFDTRVGPILGTWARLATTPAL